MNEFRDFDTTGKSGYDNTSDKTTGINGDAILELYDMQDVSIGENVLWLFLMIFGYRAIFYLFLKYLNKTP